MCTSLSDERVYAWENIGLSYRLSATVYYTHVLCYIWHAPLDDVLHAGFSLSDGSPLLENAPGVYSNHVRSPPAAGIEQAMQYLHIIARGGRLNRTVINSGSATVNTDRFAIAEGALAVRLPGYQLELSSWVFGSRWGVSRP